MKIAIAQLNCTLGDLSGNAAKILDYANRAKQQGAALLLTPELSLCGYPPEDLLLRDGFYHACDVALNNLALQVGGISVVVGHPHELAGKRYNAASVLRDGRIIATYHKHELPNYSVFDEERYFTRGITPCVFELQGIKFGLNICADIWQEHAAQKALDAGAQILLVLNASPYHIDKQQSRYEAIRDRIGETRLPVVYANLVGGQDELVFDGASFAMSADGHLTHQFASFEENWGCLKFRKATARWRDSGGSGKEASIYKALCLGVKIILARTISRRAAGPVWRHRYPLGGGSGCARRRRVRAVMMPSPYTRKSAWTMRARWPAFWVCAMTSSIFSLFQVAAGYTRSDVHGLPTDTTEENLQARIRGNLLMALSNKTGPRFNHRKQVGNDRGLLHAVRRHGGRFCGLGCEQDLGIPLV
jgi:predicted amidohydrolase